MGHVRAFAADNPLASQIFKVTSFLLLSLYFISYCRYGLNLWDEGALLNGGLRVLEGEMPVRDFNGYPPGRYLLASLAFLCFGEAIYPLRVAVSVLTALSVMCLYSSAKQIMPGPFAALSSLLYLLAPSVYYNRFFPIFLLIGIYSLFRLVDAGRSGSLAGFVLTPLLALLFKFEIAVIIYVAGVMVLRLSGRGGGSLFICGALAVGAVVVYNGTGYFVDFARLLLMTYENWGTPVPVPLFPASFSEAVFSRGFFDASLFYVPPLIYSLCSLCLIRLWLRKKGVLNPKELKILSVLIVGLLSYGLVIWRAGFDNLVRVLPPATLLGCYFLSVCFRRAKGAIPWALFAVAALFPAWYGFQMLWNHGYYVGSVGAIKERGILLPLDRARVYTNEVELDWIVDIADFLKKNTSQNDLVFALPLNPVWNFLSDRKNPTSFEWVIPSTMRNPEVESLVISELDKTPPKYIILSDLAIDNRESRRFSNYARDIYLYILERYRVKKEVGIFLIFERVERG